MLHMDGVINGMVSASLGSSSGLLGPGLRGLSSLDVEDEEESESESLEVELVPLGCFFFASGLFFLGCVLDSSSRTGSAAGSASAGGSVLDS